MASRTGTASQVDGSGGNGSTSVTVPADATGAVAFWAHFDSNGSSTMATLTLGGNSFTVRAQNAEGVPADATGTGVATLTSLPGTGTQTFAWTWSAGGARHEGGGIWVVWIKDMDASDVFRDADTNTQPNLTTQASVTIDSVTTDLVLGMGQEFDGGGSLTINATTTFVNSVVVNSEQYDVGEWTAGAATTNCATTGNVEFNTMAAISIKNAPAPAAGVAVAWIKA